MPEPDYTRVMFGANALHIPAWMVVQDQGPGLVSFIGASRVDEAAHPLRYGSEHTHQLIVGEFVVRPHTVTASNAGRGMGLDGLATNPFVLAEGVRIV